MEPELGLELDQHKQIGDILKRQIHDLEVIRAMVINAYPKSSDKKEAKKLEAMIEAKRDVQIRLHSRLLNEYAEAYEDSELLPIYLGRYES